MPRKNIYITEEQKKLLEQNPNALKLGLKTALELSIGCMLTEIECYIIKGKNYNIYIMKNENIVVLKSGEEIKAHECKPMTVDDYGKLQTFAKQNPTYSPNLVYKFKSLLENGN